MAGRLPHLQTRYHPPEEQSTGSLTPVPAAPEVPKSTPQAEQRPQDSRPRVNQELLPRPVMRHDDFYGGFVPDGASPPHVYANYTVKEDRISSPRFLRFASAVIAMDNKAQEALGLPIACVWHALADQVAGESLPPVSDVSTKGPFRCSRCMAYANPFFVFPDSGRTVTCNMCGLTQPCSEDLFIDRSTRPELFSGTYDFQVAHEFLVKPPQLNTFLLCLDVSAEALNSGLPLHVLASLKSSLDYMPCPERTRIALMLYSDKFVYYRPCTQGLPQEIVINETEEPFVADSIEALAFRLDSQKDALVRLIDALQEKLTPNSPGSKQVLAPGAVVSAAKDMLEFSGGRVLLFTSTLGTIGKLKLRNREDMKLYNTENEKTLYPPQSDQTYDLAKDCSAAGVTVDFFVCCGRMYVDTASMYPLASITGGDLHYFPDYSTHISERLHFTLVRTLTRNQIFQVLMRVRCSNGLTVDEYIGHFNRKGPTDMEIAILDADKALTVMLKHEEKLKDGGQYYLQGAMLYSSLDGHRFIRVFNSLVKAAADTTSIYRSADADVIANVLAKKQLLGMLGTPLKAIREHWHEVIVQILYHYRTTSSNIRETTSLMLPESLNVLPLFTIAAMKLQAFSQSRVNADPRMYMVAKLKGMPVTQSFLLFYPRIYSVHDLLLQAQQPGTVNRSEMVALPNLVPDSINKVVSTGAYLIDNGDILTLFVGADVPSEFLLDVTDIQAFAVQSFAELKEELNNGLPELDSELSQRLQAVIAELHRRNTGNDATAVKSMLVEDSTASEMSYADYLLNLHRVIMNKLDR